MPSITTYSSIGEADGGQHEALQQLCAIGRGQTSGQAEHQVDEILRAVLRRGQSVELFGEPGPDGGHRATRPPQDMADDVVGDDARRHVGVDEDVDRGTTPSARRAEDDLAVLVRRLRQALR
ncbi:hypothetical protein ACGFMO_25790 [Streptomyces niveus]|uniref:hypothetical protein n=1 Tax=Streptomyces niveus TaxID=193462 RepID=UPI003722C0D0